MTNYSDINIEWQSEITAKMGYGLQARRMLKPLIDGGAKVKIIPDEDYLPAHMRIDDPYWNNIIEQSKSMLDAPIRICYCLPNRYKPDPNKITVGYSMWETTEYPKEWAAIINKTCDYFLAGCKSLVDSAKAASISCPIHYMNATLDTNDWNPEGPKLSINEIPDTDIKFLFIGNFIPRKNLEELLLGFAVAFENVTDVSLIIKTWSTVDTAEGKNHISQAIRHMYDKAKGLERKPKVSIITDILDEEQILQLMRSCDVYTSVSRGEGFDLPLMQAMSMEKVIVTTRFLAHGDYLDDSNSINVPFTLTPCVAASSPLYDAYQMWSSPDMKNYIKALREAYKGVKEKSLQTIKVNARKTIESKFSIAVNTDHIANTIRNILKETNEKKQQNSKELIQKMAIQV